ncbi:MAG: metallophosphoesterase [Polyangiaceae bacterium]
MRLTLFTVRLALVVVVACDRGRVEEPDRTPVAVPAASAPFVALSAKLARPAPERLVAIGDFHGDLDHTRRALRLAGAIDTHDRWIGGPLVVVQTGDEVDRGDDDRAILDLVEDLKRQAAGAGGELVALLGNHEIMNASLDFRYVTSGGFDAFPLAPDPGAGSSTSPRERGRAAAFAPGGPYATMLAHRPLLAEVGDSVFVHGGVLPKHVAYGLDRMNDQLDDWLLGKRTAPPPVVVAEDGPVWTRAYSGEEGEPDCADLSRALGMLGAKRMVVGHTVQHRGINSACGGAVWRIDVGLSHYFGGPIEALEIRGDAVRVLREDGHADH